MQSNSQPQTIVIGAGLAGLCCAGQLAEAGIESVVLEASDRVGGRVRTDHIDGFTLDHGFQVLLTDYPACRQLLDYDALELKAFAPGALIRFQGRFTTLGDPWRRPQDVLSTALNPVPTWADKIRIVSLRRRLKHQSLENLYQQKHQTTRDALVDLGFSDQMVRCFFEPFLGGVFLDESLATSSRMFEFVFKFFSSGTAAVPAAGMAAIPEQLASRLPPEAIRFGNSVTKITDQGVVLSCGETLSAERIVIATESDAAAKLTGNESLRSEWNATSTIYFATRDTISPSKMLMLRGDETEIIQTAVILSNIAPSYAPPGQSLISVSLGPHELDQSIDELEPAIRSQLSRWLGTDSFRRLAAYRIPYGLPRRRLDPVVMSTKLEHGSPHRNLFVCGDHRETPSIQGAMNSGLRAAREVIAEVTGEAAKTNFGS